MEFTKDPSTHPANGPLTEERLIRVRDELAAAAKRSDGGNLGYMMADAAKAIDELLAVRKAGNEPVADVVAWHHPTEERTCDIRLRRHDLTPGPLYAAPQLPQPAVPDENGLLPCPFCGSPAEHYPDGDMEGYSVMCGHKNGDCDSWIFGFATPEEAERSWNTRAAVLQGAEPVSQPYTLRDGIAAIRNSGIAIDSKKIQMERLGAEFEEVLSNMTYDEMKPVTPEKCWCHTCRPVVMGDMRFVVCPECGNKRCPRANDCRNVCSGSNDPGQAGSAYPAAPQQEV